MKYESRDRIWRPDWLTRHVPRTFITGHADVFLALSRHPSSFSNSIQIAFPFLIIFLFLFPFFFLPISLSTVRNEFSFLFFFENSTRSTWLKFHPSCHKLINLRWINNRSITISPLSWRNNSDDNHWLAYQQRQSLVTMPWLRNEILSGFRWQFSGISTESWKNPKKVTHGQKPSGAPPPPISPPCPPPPPPPPSPEPHFNI